MSAKKRGVKADIDSKVVTLYMLFILVGIIVISRILWVQLFSEEVAENAIRISKRIYKEDTIPARRGNILARNGDPLATSLFHYQVGFDFSSVGLDSLELYNENVDSLSKLLSAHFGDRTPEQYAKFFREERQRRFKLTNRRDTTHLRDDGVLMNLLYRITGDRYITRTIYDTMRDDRLVDILPRKVNFKEWSYLRKFPLLNWNMGMVYHPHKSDERLYPKGELARRTIGLIGDRGEYGIEMVYRDELSGKTGKELRKRIARGFSSSVAGAGYKAAVNGLDVVTTLDVDIQSVAHRALLSQLEQQNAQWGTTIVMHTRTGEILAIANLGRNSKGEYRELENYALGRSMEPGSTFKLATVLTLLENAKMPETTIYDTYDGKPVTVGPAKRIRDSHEGDNEIDLRRAVVASSNVYFARAMWDIYGITGRKMEYSDYLHNELHLGKTVGFEPFGERTPEITTDWKVPDPGVMLVKMSYGYRVKMTPMQMLTFYNAIANDGEMITPILVKELRDEDGVVERFKAETIDGSICSRSTLRTVRSYLEGVASEGTASAYFSDTLRLRVAAKTGTAQVTNEPGHYLGSMVAYFPADNPEYTIITSIKTKRQAYKAYYGGPLAGPVNKAVVDYIYTQNRDWHSKMEPIDEELYPKRIKGGDVEQCREVADELMRDVEWEVDEGIGRVEIDSLSRAKIVKSEPAQGRMPNVRGMGLKDALYILESRGLKVSVSGSGVVVWQSITPNSHIKEGATVSIRLR